MNNQQAIPEEQLEEIERFLLNEMSSQEREDFLARAAADPELEKRTEEMRVMLLAVQQAFLEEKLDDFHKDMPAVPAAETTAEARTFPVKKWLAAASIILVLAFSGWWFFLKPNREEALFAKYYDPEPGLISAMSTSDNYLFDRAMIDYKTGNYDAAIKAWDSLHITQPNNDTLNYFLGSAYLVTDEAEKAIPYLEKVAALPNSFFVNDATWYAGLALLKTGRKKEAITYIERSVHEDKNELLTKLKRKNEEE